MKILSLTFCLLALASMTLWAGCGGGVAYYPFKGSEQRSDTVSIDKCVASPDSVIVPTETNLHWIVTDALDQATYTIAFTNGNPLVGHPQPTLGVNAPDPPHKVEGNFPCYTWWDRCGKFPYTLTRKVAGQPDEVCKDPGVHVSPN